jgi:hypothetical protein
MGVAFIMNNTFIGGSIICGGHSIYEKRFVSNIFYRLETLQRPPGCIYDYNLTMPTADLGGMGNTTGDPLFVNAANNDYHLGRGSPAIDAAAPMQTNSRDRDGVPRPQGTRSDIGAFEYVP